MPVFITLSHRDFSGDTILINPAHITALYNRHNGTDVWTTGKTWAVKESREEIIALIDKTHGNI